MSQKFTVESGGSRNNKQNFLVFCLYYLVVIDYHLSPSVIL